MGGHQHLINLPEGVNILDMNVAMSNALVRASQSLDLSEKRLISACLAKTGRQSWPTGFKDTPPEVHEQNWKDWVSLEFSPFTVRISVDDYSAAGQVDKSTAYTQLKQAAASLYQRSIRMKIKTPQGDKIIDFRWVEASTYMDGEGWVELSWSWRVAEHIYDLKGKFTLYKLRQTASLGNIYAIRLFEQFVSWSTSKNLVVGTYKPTLDEFNLAMSVPEAYLKDFAGIRRRVIEKAVDELKKTASMAIDWKPVTRGRKTVGLIFTYAPKQDSLELFDEDVD